MNASFPRTSVLFASLAVGGASGPVTVRTIVAALGDRAHALLIVLLGLPNCLPMPPPIPLVCGLLLLVVALQIIAGRTVPWLPERLLDKRIAGADIDRACGRATPWLLRLERVARPRFTIFETRVALRLVGCALFVFAAALIVAAPFLGQVPLGLSVCLIGLGLVERDGLIVLGGMSVGVVGSALSLAFVLTVASGAAAIF